ncbi:MAG: hypothetical protein HQL95_00660 [Magnetococcales bacterium]|nr:hypothetical protein [Magnetococcales bacterium]
MAYTIDDWWNTFKKRNAPASDMMSTPPANALGFDQNKPAPLPGAPAAPADQNRENTVGGFRILPREPETPLPGAPASPPAVVPKLDQWFGGDTRERSNDWLTEFRNNNTQTVVPLNATALPGAAPPAVVPKIDQWFGSDAPPRSNDWLTEFSKNNTQPDGPANILGLPGGPAAPAAVATPPKTPPVTPLPQTKSPDTPGTFANNRETTTWPVEIADPTKPFPAPTPNANNLQNPIPDNTLGPQPRQTWQRMRPDPLNPEPGSMRPSGNYSGPSQEAWGLAEPQPLPNGPDNVASRHNSFSQSRSATNPVFREMSPQQIEAFNKASEIVDRLSNMPVMENGRTIKGRMNETVRTLLQAAFAGIGAHGAQSQSIHNQGSNQWSLPSTPPSDKGRYHFTPNPNFDGKLIVSDSVSGDSWLRTPGAPPVPGTATAPTGKAEPVFASPEAAKAAGKKPGDVVTTADGKRRIL